MTTETEHGGSESANAQEARAAIDAYLSRTSARPAGAEADDHVAESVAREAWDAVQDATPPPPDPGAGPVEKTEPSPQRAELHRKAVAIARGLRELGYHLDETLLPGPDMAAG
ncbi:hypothetical protein ACFYN0_17420 [Streptomyces sp. NPDC006704]|uniref:hypothetical protein n=1 Tax=Streptomyces sp. NPDC006704 TaxID=3364760 RepID=UPI003683B11F